MTKWQIYDICVNALSLWGEVEKGGVKRAWGVWKRGVRVQEKKVEECEVKNVVKEY